MIQIDEDNNFVANDSLQSSIEGTVKIIQYIATLVVCLGALSAGTAISWTSPVLPQLSINTTKNITSSNTSLYLTTEQQTWVSSLLAIGAFFGALPTGYIADKIGRRYATIIMDIPFILSWIIIYFANSAFLLYLGRFIIGISTGSFCVLVPMYISEIAEINIRGSLGTLFQLMITIGILLVSIIGSLVSWTTLSALFIIPPTCLLIGMLFLPETPVYLLKKGLRNDAVIALKWLWGRKCDANKGIQLIQCDLDAVQDNASFKDLFHNSAARKGLFISITLMLLQQLSGINAVIFFTVPIFQASGSTMDPSLCSIIVCSVQVIFTIISSILMEKAGRKSLLLFSSIIMAISLAVLGGYFNMKENDKDVTSVTWLPLVSLVLYIVTFSLGFGPIPWLIMGELFLPVFKSTAVGLTVMMNWLFTFFITKTFANLISYWGLDITFWFFSICMIIASVYIALIFIETKGKTNSQIQAWLNGKI